MSKIVQLVDKNGDPIYPNVWVEGMSSTNKVQLVDKSGTNIYPLGVVSEGTQLTDKSGNNVFVVGVYEDVGTTYSVFFDTNGGTPASFTKMVKEGDIVAEPTNVEKEHYVLKGWEVIDG